MTKISPFQDIKDGESINTTKRIASLSGKSTFAEHNNAEEHEHRELLEEVLQQ